VKAGYECEGKKWDGRGVFFFVDWVLAVPPPTFCKVSNFFGTNLAMKLRIKQNLPARSHERGEAQIPRVGKGMLGLWVKRARSAPCLSCAADYAACKFSSV
jgi:hypothetical protein